MIFRLFADDFLQHTHLTEDLAFRAALDNLTRAHREGKHVLCFERRLYPWIVGIPELSREARQALDDARLREDDARQLWEAARARVRVHAQADYREWKADGPQRTLHLPFAALKDSASTQRTVLLAEHQVDAELIELIARLVSRKTPGVTTSLEPRGGGGDSTALEARSLLDHGRAVLVVFDSDRRRPKGGLGDTARKVDALARERPDATLGTWVTPACTLENLIPESLAVAATRRWETGVARPTIDRAIEAGLLAPRCFDGATPTAWLPLKRGLTRRSLNKAETAQERRYLEDVIAALRLSVACPPECGAGCSRLKEEPCTCVFLPAIPGKLVEACRDHARDNPDHLDRLIPPGHTPLRDDLGPLAFAWGCAFPPQRL